MATTTNFGWTTPNDTDLVKDGAAAIRTLGSSIDTSFVDLKGGTTGQLLSKASATDLDFTWATPAVAGGMTLISTTTLTGATVVLSSIPQTYKSLYLVIRNFNPAGDNRSMNMRFNNDSTASRHFSTINYGNSTAQTFSATEATLATGQDDTVATGLVSVEIPDYTNTTTWKMCRTFSLGVDSSTTTQFNTTINTSAYNQIDAITSLGFITNAGNFDSGTILLYGVN